MLDIIDMNTSAGCLDEVLRLKESFKTCLANVKDGTVLIINNFPAHEVIDYLIIVNIEKKNGNYYRIRYNESNHYIDNIVLGILKYPENNITEVDSVYLHSVNASYNYLESNTEFNRELRRFLGDFQEVWCWTLFQVNTPEQITYFSPELLLNEELTADKILESFAIQQIKHYPKVGRISAFPKDNSEKLTLSNIQEFVEKIELLRPKSLIFNEWLFYFC